MPKYVSFYINRVWISGSWVNISPIVLRSTISGFRFLVHLTNSKLLTFEEKYILCTMRDGTLRRNKQKRLRSVCACAQTDQSLLLLKMPYDVRIVDKYGEEYVQKTCLGRLIWFFIVCTRCLHMLLDTFAHVMHMSRLLALTEIFMHILTKKIQINK